jgi:hypothetical protein
LLSDPLPLESLRRDFVERLRGGEREGERDEEDERWLDADEELDGERRVRRLLQQQRGRQVLVSDTVKGNEHARHTCSLASQTSPYVVRASGQEIEKGI